MRSFLFVSLALFGCAHVPSSPGAGAPSAAAPAYDAELRDYAYPREVRYFEFRSQGQALRMAYELAEPTRPNGRTALLLHGKNFGAAYWEPTIRALLDRGFRVIAPDQIGFGKSSKPHDYQFSFQQLARSTRDLLDLAGAKRVSVVGHSMGGMLATRFALMFPERVEKLALIDPIGLEDWKAVVPYRTIDEWYAAEVKATPESIREYMRVSYFGGKWRPELEPLIEAAAGWTRSPDFPKVAWCAALTYDMIYTQPVLYEFPRLRPQTLLIIGQRDRTALGKAWAPEDVRARLGDYPKLGKAAARAIPRARLVEVPEAGHLPQIDAFSEYFRALADFLDEA